MVAPAPAVRLRYRGDSTDGACRLASDGRRRRHAAGWNGHLARSAPCALLGLCPPVRDRSGHHRVVPAGRDAAGARRDRRRPASVPARGARRGHCRVLRRSGRFRHVPDREPGRALRRAGVGDAPASGARHPLERGGLQLDGCRRVVAAAQPVEPNSPERLRGRVHASRLPGRGVELPGRSGRQPADDQPARMDRGVELQPGRGVVDATVRRARSGLAAGAPRDPFLRPRGPRVLRGARWWRARSGSTRSALAGPISSRSRWQFACSRRAYMRRAPPFRTRARRGSPWPPPWSRSPSSGPSRLPTGTPTARRWSTTSPRTHTTTIP